MIVSMNVDELDAKLRAWREEDNTPEKVAVTHRPVSMKRLKTLTGFPRVKASWALLENST